MSIQGGEDLSSTFHNDLYTFNFEKRRWFAAEMRIPKKAAGVGTDPVAGEASSSGSTGAYIQLMIIFLLLDH